MSDLVTRASARIKRRRERTRSEIDDAIARLRSKVEELQANALVASSIRDAQGIEEGNLAIETLESEIRDLEAKRANL